ncbi:DeoR/GlpR family DNA-binding transcription regulator [Frankia sp. Cr1]|uniref:DeoR/GlpR family DNA-binding transcription regulator n=1 Tax=Frankia sp. Cr1 TaxID=3073931 RepID=UPI002AD4FBEC|nr:DeoR/GlpR family DNA-binding transcription regulator [Frankia sp. Cr1]
MLAAQRQALILAQVGRDGAVRVSDLVDQLQVSDMTIRRDLDALARRGLVEKVHGGATAVPTASAVEPGFEAKSQQETSAKGVIAAEVARMVGPGDAVALTAGTTTWAVAERLVAVPNLTVVTNSVPVADAFHHHGRPDQTVVLTGGVRTPSGALVGPVAVHALRFLHIDLLFMGVHGMHSRYGFTTPNLLECQTNQAFIEAAARLVVVADHTKWGTVGLSTIADLDAAHVLVSDEGLAEEHRAELSDRVGELIIAAGDPASEEQTAADRAVAAHPP